MRLDARELAETPDTENSGQFLGSQLFNDQIETALPPALFAALGRAADPRKRGRPAESTTDVTGDGGRLT
jgi:hypothetical protein